MLCSVEPPRHDKANLVAAGLRLLAHMSDVRRQKEAIGKRLQAARRDARLELAEVAARIGVSRTTLHRWERGHQVPSAIDLVALAELYRTTIDWLLGRPGPPSALFLLDDRVRTAQLEATSLKDPVWDQPLTFPVDQMIRVVDGRDLGEIHAELAEHRRKLLGAGAEAGGECPDEDPVEAG